jgi:hypothetical protein
VRPVHWLMSVALILGGGGLMIGACSHSADRKLDAKVAEEYQVRSATDVSVEAQNAIDSAPGLRPDQRSDLKELGKSLRSQMDALRLESNQLRAVLIDDIVATNYDRKEVELIKSRITAVESRRVALTMGAVDQASEIMGRRKAPRVLHDFALTGASRE